MLRFVLCSVYYLFQTMRSTHMNINERGPNGRFKLFVNTILQKLLIFLYIYMFIAIALDENSVLVALHSSMQNIYQSRDLGHAVERSNVNLTFFVY